MEYVILNYICKKILTDGGWIMNLPSAFEEKMRGLLDIKYIGSGVMTSSIGMNKYI